MNTKGKTIAQIFLYVLIALWVLPFTAYAQEKTDEELQKKYEAIVGDYEFDWGQGAVTLGFYIKDGELWADSGDGRPAVMKAVEGADPFTFTAEDPEAGVFNISFSKDEEGEYTVCHVVNDGMALDITGTKIK